MYTHIIYFKAVNGWWRKCRCAMPIPVLRADL